MNNLTNIVLTIGLGISLAVSSTSGAAGTGEEHAQEATKPPFAEKSHETSERHAEDHGTERTVTASNQHEDHASDGHKESGDDHSEKEGAHSEKEGAHSEKEGAHSEKEGAHSEKEEGLRLNDRQIREADIVVKAIELTKVPLRFVAPGEVKLNSYRTQIVTPRIPAMVVRRHASMGDLVQGGQSLAALFSVEMAQAQGDFVVARSEWERVRKLGEKLVSAKRATVAQVAYQQARARLLAYGLTSQQIAKLSLSGRGTKPGQFNLLAAQDGLITWDQFQVGEMIEPGRPIYRLTDPDSRWVEARVNPEEAIDVGPGDSVGIIAAGRRYEGIVAQLHQSIDEQTRTLGVRIEIADGARVLRPGQFVDVVFQKNTDEAVIALPREAVLRNAEGEWTVYRKTEKGTFEAVEIEILRESNEFVVIQGVQRGTQIAVQGAFFIQSEIAKSGFDIHNH